MARIGKRDFLKKYKKYITLNLYLNPTYTSVVLGIFTLSYDKSLELLHLVTLPCDF